MQLPPPARYAMDAAQAIGADYQDLDAGGGYLFRVSRNGRSVLAGGGGVSAYPVNSAAGFTIARDKSHTKSVLRAAGLPHIPGGLFFAHKRRVSMRGPGREIEDAQVFAAALGFPVFCKPNQGGRGNFAEIISSEQALGDYARRLAVEFESFVVEPLIIADEHRVFVQDGRALFHYSKTAPSLVGDGFSTVAELLRAFNARLEGTGVSPCPEAVLESLEEPADAVPVAGQTVALPGRRNLHAAGDSETVTTEVPPVLADIAIRATEAVGLRIGAVDLFDASPARDFSEALVIEVNGNPGLETLERAGRTDLIRQIWVDMLVDCLER